MNIGHVGKTVLIEEISRVSGAMGAALQASQLGVAKIIHFGNEDQKRKWLPAIAVGDCLPTIAVTEPNRVDTFSAWAPRRSGMAMTIS
jgi:acyl-CoA dehydrogenase